MLTFDMNTDASNTAGNMEPTMVRMLSVRLVPRASYVARGARDASAPAPAAAAVKGAVSMDVPYSLTMRDVACALVRETSAPRTAAMRVRGWFGMSAPRTESADAEAARAAAVQLYVEERTGDGDVELAAVPPLTLVEALAPLADPENPLSDPVLTMYYSKENTFGDDADLCLACCALCACCAACCAASTAVNAANQAKKPQPQPQPQTQNYAPPNQQGPYNYAGGNDNMYMAQTQNNYGAPNNGQQQGYYGQQQGYGQQPPYNYNHNNYAPPQGNQYGMPPAQGYPVAGQPVQTAAATNVPPQYNTSNTNNNNNNNNTNNMNSYGNNNNGSRSGTAAPQEVVFSARPPSPRTPPAAPEFSPAEGRDSFEYPTERPAAAATGSGLPPPQYNLSGFDNADSAFDEAKKDKTGK